MIKQEDHKQVGSLVEINVSFCDLHFSADSGYIENETFVIDNYSFFSKSLIAIKLGKYPVYYESDFFGCHNIFLAQDENNIPHLIFIRPQIKFKSFKHLA